MRMFSRRKIGEVFQPVWEMLYYPEDLILAVYELRQRGLSYRTIPVALKALYPEVARQNPRFNHLTAWRIMRSIEKGRVKVEGDRVYENPEWVERRNKRLRVLKRLKT